MNAKYNLTPDCEYVVQTRFYRPGDDPNSPTGREQTTRVFKRTTVREGELCYVFASKKNWEVHFPEWSITACEPSVQKAAQQQAEAGKESQ